MSRNLVERALSIAEARSDENVHAGHEVALFCEGALEESWIILDPTPPYIIGKVSWSASPMCMWAMT